MSTHIYRVCLIVGTLACVNTNSQETFRSDDHAPIGVMADHYHEAGELIVVELSFGSEMFVILYE